MIISDILTNSSTTTVKAKVELYKGSTLVKDCSCNDILQDFTISRVGEESKFFGFGVCQKISVKLIDFTKELVNLDIDTIKVAYVVGENTIYPYPTFYKSEINRDQKTNIITITAYDKLASAAAHNISEVDLNIDHPILGDYIMAIVLFLGFNSFMPVGFANEDWVLSTPYYIQEPYEVLSPNLDGSEKVRDVLNALAEASQAVYYLDSNETLIFKRLDKDGEAILRIPKDDYFEFDTSTNRRLTGISHITELGDNVEAKGDISGTTQYVRDNPFWELREDIATLVDNALAFNMGLTINQFSCSWIGNILLEIGDKIAITAENDEEINSYVLNDTIVFDGSLSEMTEWHYEDGEQIEGTPTNLTDAIKHTYARVDRVNHKIDLVVQEVSKLQMDVDSITASVGETIDDLTNEVKAKMTEEEVVITVRKEMLNGTTKVATNTGYTLDDEGLTISKENAEMKTQITEDGMTVYRSEQAVLVANNEGVEAENLHASTYLIVGSFSRFEDYFNTAGEERTGCFWIGL